MSYKIDLETHIRESYKLICEYEEIQRLSDSPKEIQRAKRVVDEQWTLIKEHLENYIPLCEHLRLNLSEDLTEIVMHFPEYRVTKPETTLPGTKKTVEIFFSYAHEDERLQNDLIKHLSLLKHEGLIDSWYNRQIKPGEEWATQIDTHLYSAQIILLLISAHFLASDYCYGIEMKRALERHDAKGARVIPIILSPVDWESAPFSKLQALPRDGKPVTTWANCDDAFLDITKGIRVIVKELVKNT